MIKVRGAFIATAVSVLLLGGMLAPAIAQTAVDVDPPYTERPDPEDPNGDPDDPNGEPDDPNGEVVPPEEEPSEVEREIIIDTDSPEADPVVDDDEPLVDDEGVAAPTEPRVLGTILARTGIDAWLLILVGVLLVGGGIAVLAVRRQRNVTDH